MDLITNIFNLLKKMSFTIQFQFYWLDDELGKDMNKEELKSFLLESYNSVYPRYVEYILQMIELTDASNRFIDNEDEFTQNVAHCIRFDSHTLVATLEMPRKLWCADGPYWSQHFTKYMRGFYIDEFKEFVETEVNIRSQNQAGPSVCTHPSGAIATVNII